jgi:hypothetical protein
MRRACSSVPGGFEVLGVVAVEERSRPDYRRGADAAGFRTAIYAGLDVVGPLYATKTEFGSKFREMVATEGIPAAVRWRAAQFKE